MRKDYSFLLLSLLLFSFASICTAQNSEKLGSIDFPATGKAEAVAKFIEGTLLLHSFEYQDAATAFSAAREIDPDMVMAYWGEAMTKNHPIWNQQDKEEALEILNLLAPSPAERSAKAQTQWEKDYLHTAEVLYGEGTKEERDDLFSESMANLSAKYPGDLEAKSLYALSILGTCQGKRDFRKYMKAGAVAREVYDVNPKHPGAAHYIIHSFDDPIHAPLGLEAAESYAAIAPDAAHANHMPSHIFMALGLWQESNATNVRSKQAAKSKGRHGLHATWWLTYGYLQTGQIEKAKAEIEELSEIAKTDKSRSVHSHLAYMVAHFIHEYGSQLDSTHLDRIDLAKVSGSAEANLILAKALMPGNQRDVTSGQERLEEIQNSDGMYVVPEEIEIMRHQLHAIDANRRGDLKSAYEYLDRALEVHERMAVEFGPPSPVKPLHEYYADIALEAGDTQKAKQLYGQAQLDKPGRWQTVNGLAKIAKLADDQTGLVSNACYLGELLEDADREFSKYKVDCEIEKLTEGD